MKRIAYVLLALAAVMCSIGAGVMTYQSALDADARAQKKAELMDQLAREAWYLPLSEEYSGIHAVRGADRELYGAFKGNKEIIMDRNGKVTLQIPESMDIFDMSLGWISSNMDTGSEGDGLLMYQDCKSGKLGYIDLDGNVVIKARYDSATAFSDGCAIVEKPSDLHSGVDVQAPVDKSGQVLYDTEKLDKWPDLYTSVSHVTGKYFLLESRVDSSRRLFDAERKEIIREWSGAVSWFDLAALGEERYVRRNSDRLRMLDERFDPIEEVPLFSWMDRFSEGLCYAKWKENGEIISGYIDRDGQVKIRTPHILYGSRFTEGKAFLWEKEKVRVIDQTGRTLFEKKLAEPLDADICGPDEAGGELPADLAECWYRDGMAVCYDGKKFGIIDDNGSWVIDPVFSSASFSGEDAAVVYLDSKEGILKVGGRIE